jgi:putative ABC transport system permease protein
MNIPRILLRFLQQRAFASSLTAASVAVGVALVATIVALRLESERSFSQKDTGFEVVVGAKGSPLQLVLHTLYHIGTPVGNIPLAVYEQLQQDRRVQFMLPMVFGDNVGGFKVVGTTPDFFTRFQYRKGQSVALAQGRAFAEHGEVVLGAEVASTLRLRIGDSVTVKHGVQEQDPTAHEHGKLPVVGVLAPTQTAIDKGVYSTMYTVWDTHYHEYLEAQEAAEAANAPAETKLQSHEEHRHSDHHHSDHHHSDEDEHHDHDIPAEFTTITAMAVKLKSPVFFDSFIRTVNDGTQAQAAMPIREIMALFAVVGNVNSALLGISYLVIVLSAVALVVSLYNSLSERQREIATLRSLGARRGTIVVLVLAEAVAIGLAGASVGIVAARVGLRLAKQRIGAYIGNNVEFALLYNFDAWMVMGVVVLSAVVALLPAWKAYRTDVAEHLAPLS